MKSNFNFSKACGCALVILSVLLAVGAGTVFKACGPAEDGSFMNCHNAQAAVAVTGGVLAVLAVVSVSIGNSGIRLAAQIAMLPLSVLVMLFPQTIIHLCMMPGMRCRAVLRPCAIIFGVLILAVSVVRLIAMRKEGTKA